MSYLGIDVGTTGCKVAAFDRKGKVLHASYREYPLYHPREGWLELDADEVFSCVEECMLEVSASLRTDPPVSLALSAQGEAVVPVDGKGRVLARSPVTFDRRGDDFVPFWEEKIGRERFFEITGTTLSGIGTVNKILWWKREMPEVIEKAQWFLCFEDFLMLRMGVEPAINYPLAGRTMMFDVGGECWSREILAIAGIEKERLARPLPSGVQAGEVGVSFREKMGWMEKVVVAAGAHDQPSGALGSGVIQAGIGMDATGTVECIAPALPSLVLNAQMRENNLCSYHHAFPGLFITLIYNFTGGSILRWYRDTFACKEREVARERGEDVYDIILADIPDDPTGLLVLPHFTMSGTPFFDSRSCGMVVGLKLDTSRSEFVRALLEGISLEMKFNLELLRKAGVEVHTLRAVGGGARNRKWLQLKADIYGVPVETLNISEAACLGASLLGRKAREDIGDFTELVESLVRVEKVYEPRAAVLGRYEDIYQAYTRLYPALKENIRPYGV